MPEYLSHIITAVISGVIAVITILAKTRFDKRKIKNEETSQIRDDYREIIDRLKGQVEAAEERLRKQIEFADVRFKAQDARMKELEAELEKEKAARLDMQKKYETRIRELADLHLREVARGNQLQARLVIANTNVGFPFPQWRKDQDLVMQDINDAYERVFLIPNGYEKKDYLGKMDRDFWPPEISANYEKNDGDVIKGILPYYRGEEIIRIQGKNVSEDWLIVKYRYNTGEGIGVAGFAIPAKLVNEFGFK